MAKTYHLYRVDGSAIPQNETYYILTPDWAYLYTNKRPPSGSREVKTLSGIPKQAMRWLSDTIGQIRAADLRENRQELLRKGSAFLKRFESELKVEREKLLAAGKSAENTVDRGVMECREPG